MRHAYGKLLRLYPREYQAAFGEEMLAAFDQAARDCRRRGSAARVYFAASELAGLTVGLAKEWTAKWKARLYCEEERVARLCMEKLLDPPAGHV